MSEHAQEKNTMTPMDAARTVEKGKLKLVKPIKDGEKEYEELNYDFGALTGWELARAIDGGDDRGGNGNNLTETQALSLFSSAAAKCTDGIDATDIRERLGAMDAITAIRVASLFFRGSLLAGSLRITKE